MTDSVNENTNDSIPQDNIEDKHQDQDNNNLREMSYVILFIAAVFVINAMETGSYRTPWPVAIITTLAGLGLFAYSMSRQSRK